MAYNGWVVGTFDARSTLNIHDYEGTDMLDNQKVASRRLVLSARELYFFQQKKQQTNKHIDDDLIDDKEDNKVYVLGYN